MPKPWNVCVTVRDEYTGCWGYVIVLCLSAVYKIFSCELIFEVIFVIGLSPSELMQCLIPPSELVQGRM